MILFFSLLLMLPIIFLASSFPLFILLTKLDEKDKLNETFLILTILFIIGGILLTNYLK